MVKRFLIIGDNHLDSNTPPSRLDNYMETCLQELHETLQIAKANKIDYYILLGDIFNRIDVGGVCRNRALEILSSDNGEPWPFEKYLVIGNHDIAHDPDLMEKSSAQALVSAGCVKFADGIEGIPVKFWHFTPKLDENLKSGVLADHDEKIMFMHASITDRPFAFDTVLFDELTVNPNTKLIFSGHIHKKMEAEKNGVKFINPGSVGRNRISDDYSKTKVSVVGLQYDFSNDEYKTKVFELKSSLPYDVVFDVEASKSKKIENKNTEKYLQTITAGSVEDKISGNITDDLILFAENRNILKEVTDMAVMSINIIQSGGEL
jgi:DNA repair exonuclease SbcCD nuclease subunit